MKKNNKVVLFSVWTYLCFWAGLMLIEGLMYIGADEWLISFLTTASSWTPTVVFLVLFPKILPGEKNRRSYIKKLFQGKKIGKTAILITIIQSAVFFLAILLIEKITRQNWTVLVQFNMVLFIYALLTTLIKGATGEELGWRGFVHFELTQKHGIIRGSILVGLLWSFWHMPLWFITSGYKGWALMFFIIVFIISNISASVIIGILYDYKQNILVPGLIHYMFNFWVVFYLGDQAILLGVLAVFYLICAIGMSIWYCTKVSVAEKENLWKIK